MRVLKVKSTLILFIILFMSCDKVEPVVETYPLSEVEFSFLHESNKAFLVFFKKFIIQNLKRAKDIG